MAGRPREIAGIHILGSVHAVAGDGTVVDLPSASQRRLLAILALHSPRRLRAEWLAEAVGVSRGALRTSVSRLRATVGEDVLQTSTTGYSLVADVDAVRFCSAAADAAGLDDPELRARALEGALAIWNGPALEEFQGEEWADGEVARLTEIHAASGDDCAEALVAARRFADAIALLERHIGRYPYRDRSRGLLIRALAGAGRQAEALRAFHQYRALLGEEVGTEPSPDVVRIERRVATGWDGVDGDDERIPRAAADTGAGVVDVPLPAAFVAETRFVGRARELETLTSELAAAKAGTRVVVLSGEAGVGKTTLLGTFARALHASGAATVVYGRCDDSGAPLQPLRTIVTSCVECAPDELLAAHVARAGGELLPLSPLLAMRVTTTPAVTVSDAPTQQFLTFGAAADLLMRVAARRPLVLLLDDLQWAEPTALRLLRHLVGALGRAPVLVVATYRDPGEHASTALRAALADLARLDARRVQLDGFDAAELRELVAAVTGATDVEPDVATAVHAATAGNALYATQLLRHWSETGELAATGAGGAPSLDVPPGLREIVWARVGGLGADVADVLTTASVLGVEFFEDVLVDMVGLPELETVDALDAATRAGLVVDLGTPHRALRFTHALVASALYADIGPSRRAHLHGLAARALEKNIEELPPDVVVQLARHCALAGWVPDAQRWSVRAGDDALSQLALAEAARHYDDALRLAIELGRPDDERADLLARLGDAQHRAGDAAALATLEQAAELAGRSGADAVLVRAVLAADRGFMRLDDRAPLYLATVEAALAAAEPSDVPTYARLLALHGQSLMYTPDAGRRVESARRALELAESGADPTLLARVAPGALAALWAPGTGERRAQVAAKAIVSAQLSGDPRLVFSSHLAAYNIAIERGDHAGAARSFAKLRALAHPRAEPRLQWTFGLCETFEATMAADLPRAEALAAATFDLGTQIGVPDAFTIFAGEAFVIGTFAGRHEELLPLVEQAATDNPEVLPFQLAYGIVCAAMGRVDAAQEVLDRGVASRFAELPVDNLWMTSIVGYAVMTIELDDPTAAASLLPLLEPFATDVAFNGITSQGPIAAYVGKLASLLGEHDLAEEHLRAGLATATAFGWRYHRATTMLALAQARHRRDGALDGEGRAWLDEAARLCHEGGFRSWAARADDLAAACA